MVRHLYIRQANITATNVSTLTATTPVMGNRKKIVHIQAKVSSVVQHCPELLTIQQSKFINHRDCDNKPPTQQKIAVS